MDNNIKDVFTIGRYFKNKFGEKVYKVPVSISGFTCPNIDGTVSKGGCTFCENDSFSPNAQKSKISSFKLHPLNNENPYLQKQLLQLEMQFNITKNTLHNKFGANKFLVYFQSFTNTYAPLDTIKALYKKALTFDNVIGLSIGTRTDSITDDILDYLVELKNTKIPKEFITNKFTQDTYEIWIEYGIQSIYNKTLEKINRGHTIENVKRWIKKTKDRDLLVCGHMIFGLPDETQDMMLNGVKESINLKIDSIKFHPLYVVKKTLLTQTYIDGKFTPISEELYIDTLVKSIKMLPKNIFVQRVTAGTSNDSLLSPMWCNDKHKQMFNIKKALLKENLNY
jgi:radical SAM protein (TIGR01212 family)